MVFIHEGRAWWEVELLNPKSIGFRVYLHLCGAESGLGIMETFLESVTRLRKLSVSDNSFGHPTYQGRKMLGAQFQGPPYYEDFYRAPFPPFPRQVSPAREPGERGKLLRIIVKSKSGFGVTDRASPKEAL